MVAYANVLGKKLQRMIIRDPGLTNYGIATSTMSKPIPESVHIDLMFTSCLSRAIQTAYHTFVKTRRYVGPILVAPYLREVGDVPENRPHPYQDAERLGVIIRRHVQRYERAYADGDTRGGIPDFIQWFHNNMPVYLSTRREVNVVVVTHGARMQTDLGLRSAPKNNQCVLLMVEDGRVKGEPEVISDGVEPPDLHTLESELLLIKTGS